MRIQRIRIPAYGPFTDFSLELPKERSDFHLVYGPNEAGKSSLLRAIRALLFGIPGQTGDNFIHDYKQLRVVAELENSIGDSRVLQRRKGNKNTLLDADENPILEAELQRMLGVVDESYFDSMFGMGSDELRRGADDLLRGEGRLGEALFSASLGGTPVDRVIRALEDEAGQLFAGRAKRRIREMTAKHGEQLRAKKDTLIKPETWEEVERALKEARDKLESLKCERAQHARRREWLGRCRSALPLVGRLVECRTTLDAMPALPRLPVSFADQVREARNARAEATRNAGHLGEVIERLDERAKLCRLNPEALELEAAIDGIHIRLGAYRDNRKALATKQAEAGTKAAAVRRTCRDLGVFTALDQLDSLRITQPRFADAAEKARELNSADSAYQEAIRREQHLEEELARLRAEPNEADPGELAALKTLLAEISKTETVAEELSGRRNALARSERTLRHAHGSLGGAPVQLEATRALTVPLRSTIEHFRDRFDDAGRALRDLEQEKVRADRKIREMRTEVERRARQGELPDVDDLESSRNHRDRGWALVLDDWKGGGAKAEFVEDMPLEQAYPEAVAAADAIADRLRQEAEAVAQLEELRSKLKLEEESARLIAEQVEKADDALAGIRGDWAKAWQNTHPAPASPKEMQEWRESWQEFVKQWDQWNEDREQLATDQQLVNEAAAKLAKAMRSNDTDFIKLLAQAKERFEILNAAQLAAAGTGRKIQDAEADLSSVRKRLPEWRQAVQSAEQNWHQCGDSLFLPEGLSPDSQIETLRSRREMFVDYDFWQSLLNECGTLEKRIEHYEHEVAQAATKLGIATEDTEDREIALWTELNAAKSAQAAHDDLQEQLAQATARQKTAEADASMARAEFDGLLTKAGLLDETELDPWLDRFETRHKLRQRLDEIRNDLAGLSLGTPLEEFITKVEAENLESLEPAITESEESLAEIDDKIDEVKSQRQDCENRRKVLDEVQDQAARHEQEAQFAISTLEADAERFVRLRVAIQLLRGQIDAFRQQNQGPFMEKASRWFAQVTGGAFSGIGTSFGAGDEPVIAGQRAGSMDEVRVPGMSEGTRDQLFLALRFAGLELHLEEHEPMPMILDDLLVHFDDTRATHALAAIAKLAESSQVLLFTHHAHVVELAKTHLNSNQLTLHKIG
jgi:uncharacterized protein YhaN